MISEEVSVDDDYDGDGTAQQPERGSDFRLAWLWVEGWRARLRKSGDVVERNRWEWRLNDAMRRPNRVPLIVAKTPGGVVVGQDETRRPRGKSVRWAEGKALHRYTGR